VSFAYRDGALSVKGEKWALSRGTSRLIVDEIDAALGYRRGALEIERFHVGAGDLMLRLEGTVDPATGFAVSLRAESSGKGKALSFLTSLPIEGAAGVEGKLSGAIATPRFDGRLHAGPVTVRGVLFSDVHGGVGFSDWKLSLTSVEIQEGSSRYLLDGTVDLGDKEPVYAAKLRVLRSDAVNIVALFYQRLPLRLSAEGELTFAGTTRNYSGGGYLTLTSGSAYGESFTRGTITTRLTTGRIAFPQVTVYKERGVVKGSGWIGFNGTYSADVQSRDVDLSQVDFIKGLELAGPFALDVHSSGTFSAPYLKASLKLDELRYRDAAIGGMSANGEIKNGRFLVNAALSGERAGLTLNWNLLKPYDWTSEARVSFHEIDPVPVLGAGFKTLSGRATVAADGTMALRGKGRDLASLSGSAVFQKLGLIFGDYRLDNDSAARFSVEGGRVSAASLNFVGPGTRLGITGGARLFSDVDLTMKGTVDLSLLRLFSRDIEHAGGAAEMKLTVKDDWHNPDIVAELHLRNGEIK
ncbi:MAG TPA: hypothetical protein VIX18_08215, partial [Nitrospirota bacterium]